ncbi:TetR/AcrR family transcriptional regulator [Nocardioides caricicola]|uniref:TetR/AcrR family transcriptional regulator n=1 Tax=Nocardioides caricicola TaxID=634770 RepID=A0ABW0MVV6_9ACTN
MSTSQGEPRRGRGRPRTPGAEERIIDAALEEYGEHGWAGFTMDGVARRAGVGKSTVYLRWQDKDSLLTEAVSTRGGTIGAVDTGSLRGDLTRLSENLFRQFRDAAGWASLRITFDAAGAHERLGRFTEAVADVQVDAVARIVQRAVDRGEVPETTRPDWITACIYGAATMETLASRLEARELSDEDIAQRSAEIIELVLDGALGRSAS